MNVIGNGQNSTEYTIYPRTIPGAPTGVVATYGNTQITLTWVTPASNGGATITNYTIIRGPTSGSETFLVTVGAVNTYTDTGLTNGNTYYYKIYAVNIAGNGPNSAEVNAVPKTTPSAPNTFVATNGNTKIVLTWTAPTSNGGSAVTGYTVLQSTISGNESYLVNAGNVLTYTNTGLTNGQTYFYMIYAVNVVGNGTISSEVNATAMTVPTAPTGVVATYGNQSITLTWVTPASNGGEPITNYTIIQGLTSGTETYYITLGVVNSFVDIGLNGTGLTNGQTYYYKVYAVNIAGNGTNSAEVNAVPKNHT